MKKVKLNKLLEQQKDSFEIKDNKEYKQVTVSNTGEIKLRSIKKGLEIGTKKQYRIKSGEFIYSRLGIHQGSFGIVPENLNGAIVTGDMPVFKIDNQKILPEILIFLLGQKEIRDILDDLTRGLAQSRIREKYLLDIEIPDLTIEEQKQILNKIQSIEKEIKKLGENVSHDESLLTKLRQAILQEAVQGKLISQNPKDEPATELLKKIKKEKEKLIKEGKIKKQKPLPEISEDEIPYDLPKSWVWCRLGDVGLFQRGKSKHRPRNDKKLFLNGKYPFVQTGDIANSKYTKYLIKSHSKNYNDIGLNQSQMWKKGTLCITIAANIAEVGFLDYDACFPDSVVSFIPLTNEFTSKYLKYFIQLTKENIETFAPSTAQKNINLGIINQLLFPLPPLPEQKRIVEKVDALMKICDDLEKQIKKNKKSSGNLIRAILREVFEN